MFHRTRRWRAAGVTVTAAGLTALGLAAPPASAATEPRVDLRVLVVDDGAGPVGAITAQLKSEGVPYTTVDLDDSGRPTITSAFLGDTVGGRPRARFQGVVLPNEAPFGAGSAEQTALETYERTYGIPQLDAYTWAHPEVGLDYTDSNGYAGPLDGRPADVTPAGRAGPFGYLKGAFSFEDNSPSVDESYGYVAQPRTGFTSYVDTPVPGGTGTGSLLGEYAHDGRRELVVTFAYNQYQQQFRVLARGMVEWLTQGVHLGQARNYFAVHVDDVFAPDARWDAERNCTPGDIDCAGGGDDTATPIRMTAADAQYLASWQQSHGFTLDMVYNAGAGEEWKTENGGKDPLADQLLKDRAEYRWVNHTYTHLFLGCVQDVTTVPWTCEKNADGSTKWVSRADISGEISNNYDWGLLHGLSLDPGELVTGEHSGLKTLPQQPQDNPNLGPALALNGVRWTASDNSRESGQRAVGSSALTVPRYPMNVYYNTGTRAEMADEYNWIYTSKADGGSGICEDNPTSTCLPEPVDTATGYLDHIVPGEAHTDLGHVLANDPRPHYVHQSNLAEDRILYPVLDRVLADYQALFAGNTPIVNLRQSAIGAELQNRSKWQTAVDAGRVTAYRIGNTVTVTAPSGTKIPVTAPEGTRQQQVLGTTAFGTAYAGERSAWASPGLLQSALTLRLP
ncbi:hypothetical protein [Streptomyces sp. SID161]|uniref:hypothetical protein n=1 Tax=unclassified Streptomyces TaxID=2593676 RepID=UPI00136E60EF|nr:hypothetical protein [Streptomyces sp. SID161]MYW19812.1 hypothetical protein [Streptomyces sp. SID2955]MYW48743.1 hypothetical protein [Streptomyces sp. SID161]